MSATQELALSPYQQLLEIETKKTTEEISFENLFFRIQQFRMLMKPLNKVPCQECNEIIGCRRNCMYVAAQLDDILHGFYCGDKKNLNAFMKNDPIPQETAGVLIVYSADRKYYNVYVLHSAKRKNIITRCHYGLNKNYNLNTFSCGNADSAHDIQDIDDEYRTKKIVENVLKPNEKTFYKKSCQFVLSGKLFQKDELMAHLKTLPRRKDGTTQGYIFEVRKKPIQHHVFNFVVENSEHGNPILILEAQRTDQDPQFIHFELFSTEKDVLYGFAITVDPKELCFDTPFNMTNVLKPSNLKTKVLSTEKDNDTTSNTQAYHTLGFSKIVYTGNVLELIDRIKQFPKVLDFFDSISRNNLLAVVIKGCKANLMSMLKILIAAKPRLLFETNRNYHYPFSVAVLEDNLDCVKFFYELSQTFPCLYYCFESPFIVAIRNGKQNILHFFLKNSDISFFLLQLHSTTKNAQQTILDIIDESPLSSEYKKWFFELCYNQLNMTEQGRNVIAEYERFRPLLVLKRQIDLDLKMKADSEALQMQVDSVPKLQEDSGIRMQEDSDLKVQEDSDITMQVASDPKVQADSDITIQEDSDITMYADSAAEPKVLLEFNKPTTMLFSWKFTNTTGPSSLSFSFPPASSASPLRASAKSSLLAQSSSKAKPSSCVSKNNHLPHEKPELDLKSQPDRKKRRFS